MGDQTTARTAWVILSGPPHCAVNELIVLQTIEQSIPVSSYAYLALFKKSLVTPDLGKEHTNTIWQSVTPSAVYVTEQSIVSVRYRLLCFTLDDAILSFHFTRTLRADVWARPCKDTKND